MRGHVSAFGVRGGLTAVVIVVVTALIHRNIVRVAPAIGVSQMLRPGVLM